MKYLFSSKVVQFCIVSSLVLGAVVISAPSTSFAANELTRELSIGMSGNDVSALQEFLAQDPTIYPQGLVTGYFGLLTKAAVANFQARNGLPPVGRVGPMTLPILNAQISGQLIVGQRGEAPVISGVSVIPSRTVVVVKWNTNELAKGVVHFSTNPLSTTEHLNYVDVGGRTAMTDTNLHLSQSVTVTDLATSTVYYYSIYATDKDGNVSMTWPALFQTAN